MQALTVHAHELQLLPWFDINCTLRTADYVVEGKILDSLGNIEIVRDYSQIKFKKKELQIEQFKSAENFDINYFYSSLIGRSVVLFIKIDSSTQKIIPSWYQSWEASMLWIEKESFKGVYQPSSPGKYHLMTFFKDRSELEIILKNWDILSQTFMHFKSYQNPEEGINYLSTIFNWHPFKTAIIREIKKEKEIAPKYLKDMIWQVYIRSLPTENEICECAQVYFGENIYVKIFSAFKEVRGEGFQKDFSDLVESLKTKITYRFSESNKEFVIEFIKFMNLNPTDDWNNEKTALREIVKTKIGSCDDDFAKTVMWHLK